MQPGHGLPEKCKLQVPGLMGYPDYPEALPPEQPVGLASVLAPICAVGCCYARCHQQVLLLQAGLWLLLPLKFVLPQEGLRQPLLLNPLQLHVCLVPACLLW